MTNSSDVLNTCIVAVDASDAEQIQMIPNESSDAARAFREQHRGQLFCPTRWMCFRRCEAKPRQNCFKNVKKCRPVTPGGISLCAKEWYARGMDIIVAHGSSFTDVYFLIVAAIAALFFLVALVLFIAKKRHFGFAAVISSVLVLAFGSMLGLVSYVLGPESDSVDESTVRTALSKEWHATDISEPSYTSDVKRDGIVLKNASYFTVDSMTIHGKKYAACQITATDPEKKKTQSDRWISDFDMVSHMDVQCLENVNGAKKVTVKP